MNAKQRFRLRRQLTAAMLQVVRVVTKMQSRGVGVNSENTVVAVTTRDLLRDLILHGPAGDVTNPLMVPTAGIKAVEAAMFRRVRETEARRRRKGYSNRWWLI